MSRIRNVHYTSYTIFVMSLLNIHLWMKKLCKNKIILAIKETFFSVVFLLLLFFFFFASGDTKKQVGGSNSSNESTSIPVDQNCVLSNLIADRLLVTTPSWESVNQDLRWFFLLHTYTFACLFFILSFYAFFSFINLRWVFRNFS